MRKVFTYFLLAISLLSFGCFSDNQGSIEIDFSEAASDSISSQSFDKEKPITVAVSAMISPKETFASYKKLFDYISKKVNIPIAFKQKRTYQEVNTMLVENEVDLAFICSGAYVECAEEIDLLAAPVCNGHPYYQAYVVVNSLSAIYSFEDLKGKSFAFTDPLSNTGKLYADKRVKDMKSTSNFFFSKTMYSNAHDISLQLVAKNVVDGATIDGLVYEYIAAKWPEKVINIRVIEKSELYGIPPLVSSRGIDTTLRRQVESVLLKMHEDEEGIDILNNLLIDKFVIVHDSIYDNIRLVNDYIAK